MQITIGIIFAILISFTAWKLGSLSVSGAISASIVGSVIFGLGGLAWGVQLLTFFITSSLLSKIFREKKSGFHEKFAKGNQRDWAQVLANGGIGSFLVILSSVNSDYNWVWYAYLGTLAAVNADTWATEIGVFSLSRPRLIINGKVVEPGTSGGISFLGLFSSFAGSTLIGITGMFFTPAAERLTLVIAITLAGFMGSLFDSFLGATAQTIYSCPVCKKETERHPNHSCGAKTFKVRGWNWLNNDIVNLSASIMGAIVAVGCWYLLA